MKNALVWGFVDNEEEIIDLLVSEDIISVKAWFTLDKEGERPKNKYHIYSFTTRNTWLDRYYSIVQEYISDVKFNQQIYGEVFKCVNHFIECDSRVENVKKCFFPVHYYLNKFNLVYNFIYAIFVKDKIDVCLFANIPHEGVDVIIYNIAKAMNIKTVILTQSSISYHYDKIFYMNSIEDYGDFKLMQAHVDNIEYKIQSNVVPFYMNDSKKKRMTFKELRRKIFSRKKNEKLQEYKDALKELISPVDYSKKYIYFPLHLQPELTTASLGGIYCDQILALERLSAIIPKDWVIYVKENPKQNEIRRDKFFFERFKLLKNVQMVPLDENSFGLIKKAQFVATITGTAGWEALVENVPVLIFGNTWYQNFEGVFRYTPDFDINRIIDYKLDYQKLEKDLNSLLSRMPYGVIDPCYIGAVRNFDKKKSVESIKNVLKNLILN